MSSWHKSSDAKTGYSISPCCHFTNTDNQLSYRQGALHASVNASFQTGFTSQGSSLHTASTYQTGLSLPGNNAGSTLQQNINTSLLPSTSWLPTDDSSLPTWVTASWHANNAWCASPRESFSDCEAQGSSAPCLPLGLPLSLGVLFSFLLLPIRPIHCALPIAPFLK